MKTIGGVGLGTLLLVVSVAAGCAVGVNAFDSSAEPGSAPAGAVLPPSGPESEGIGRDAGVRGDSGGVDGRSETGTTPAPNPLALAEAIYVRHDLSCAIRQGGTLHCWGEAAYDLSYDGTRPGIRLPKPAPWPTATFGVVSDLGAGEVSACAVKRFVGSAGAPVTCWGGNNGGSLGNGATTGGLTPSSVVGLTDAVQISGHYTLVVAVRADGTLVRWGNNNYFPATATPTVVTGLPPVRKVAAASNHFCALTTAGDVYCAGDGRLVGDGSGSQAVSPVKVSGLPSAKDLVADDYHSCAITQSGQVYCWGDRLDPTGVPMTTALSAELAPNVSQVVSLAIDRNHHCAALSSGQVVCWGYGASGQLGRGDLLSNMTPGPVSGVTNAVQVAVGERHSCARTAIGAVWCWGASPNLGNAALSSANSPNPVRVDTL